MKKFKKIFVEITNVCNLACSFCRKSSRPPEFITPAAFDETLHKLSGWTDHLALHLLGEPLLHPQIEVILERCHAGRFKVNLTTNGTLLTEKQAVLLRSPALRQINLSLHSLPTEADDTRRSERLEEILAFITAAREATPLYISLRLWNLQRGDEKKNAAILQRLADFFSLPPLSPAMTPGQGIRLAPQIFLSQEEEFVWPHAPAPDLGGSGTCRALRDHLGILVDGTVVPCCLDAEGDIPLGNLRSHSLAEILATDRARAMRDGFCNRRIVEPLCRRCSYRLRFSPGQTQN